MPLCIIQPRVLDACISITRASGRGLGPGIRKFFAPCEKMASSQKASAIWGLKIFALSVQNNAHPWQEYSVDKLNVKLKYVPAKELQRCQDL
jgi:hypothetical protein